MSKHNPIFEELKTIRDEIKVQSHLFSMEAKDEWHSLEKNFKIFESKIEDYAQKFGELNEEFWVGNKDEIEKFKKNYERMKEAHVRER